MKLRCKAGDLAIIIRSGALEQSNIGMLVKVREYVGEGNWLIRAMGDQQIMTATGPSPIAVGPDGALKPVRGDSTDLHAEREDQLVGLV